MQAAKSIQKRGSFISGFKKHWRLLVFALPALVYIIIFHYLPMYGIVIAFEDFKPYMGYMGSPFVGLKHFRRFFSQPDCWQMISNTLLLSIEQLIFSFPIPILLALGINQLNSRRYFRYNYFIGSQLDFYAAYGVVVPGDQDRVFLSINEDGNTVEYNFTDPAIQRPVNTLHTMYEEGLIPGAVFTDEWNEYLAKTRATPAFVGSFHSFHNPDPSNYVAMAPFKVEGVEQGYIRSQLNQVTRNYFTIFKNNPYPEASIRLADVIADPERSLTGFYGSIGKYLQRNDDGTYLQLPQEADEQMKEDCPGNCLAILISAEMGNKITYDGALKVRQDAVEMYKPYILPTERLYPRIMIPADVQTRYTELETYINDLTKQQFATWITKGGIEEGWDAYLANLEQAGLQEYLELAQKCYDDSKAN